MTMEDEAEQLDWGNEDDEQMAPELRAYKGLEPRVDAEDAEDAISLGSQEGDDDYYAYQPRPQQDASKGLSTPKPSSFYQQQSSHQSARELQRENSNTSQYQLSQGSPQQSPHRSSFSKITHALPPKPVVSSVPFMHPSHPSIIEATAMARGRSDRDKKTNGNVATKPVSTGDAGEPLPPDWEVRQPRSGGRGVYFYNNRTHESTWVRPVNNVSSRDKDKGRTLPPESRSVGKHGFDSAPLAKSGEPPRRLEADLPVSVLTYEDRHYRPGADAKLNTDSSKREERVPQASPYDPNPFTPSASPKPDRPPSPLQRVRDPDHLKRSGRQSPRHSQDGRGSSRVNLRDNLSDTEHHWGLSREPPPAEDTSRQRETASHPQQDRDVDMSSSVTPAFEDRNSHNDAIWSSAPRHRSPHYLHEMQASRTNVSVPPPAANPLPRQKSRFDRPAIPSQNSLRLHDLDVPADTISQGVREHELTFAQIDEENATKRMDMGDHDRPSDTVSNHRTLQAEPTPVSLPEMSSSASPSSPASQTEQSRQPKKYPYPLPPQSARFHDMFRVSKPEPMPSVPSPTLIPLGPRDGGMIQRSAIANNNVPSGPRFQPQPQSVRDANHPDFAHAPRVPPSGPSATISSRVRLPRTSNEMVFTPNESPAVRDRDTMDVDSLPPSRAPPLRTNDITIRAGSGMYADREQPADALPKAPRAMASKVSVTNTSLPPAISPSTPTTPFSTQRSASGQEFVPDKRERSPPPHIGRNDRWEPRGPPERYSRPVNTIARQDPVWRSDPLRDDARTSPAHKDMEISQVRGEQSNNQNRHQTEFGRQPPPAPVTVPNNVPIGNRNFGVNSIPSPMTGSRHRLSIGHVEPPRGRGGRGAQPKESYERSPQFIPRALPAVQGYRPNLPENASANYRRRNGHSPQLPERRLPSPTSVRSRRESYHATAGTPHYERPPSPDPLRSAPRVWTPRVQSPPIHTAQRASFGGGNYRAHTPPLSREPSLVPPSWEDSSFGPLDRTRPTGRYPDDSRFQTRMDIVPRQVAMINDSHPRRQRGIPIDRQRERFGPNAANRGGSSGGLEGRLGERYDERYVEGPGPYRPRVSPPVHHEPEEYIDEVPRQNRSDSHGRSYPFTMERPDGWTSAQGHREPTLPRNMRPERARMFDQVPSTLQPDDHRMPKPRIHRTPSTSQFRQSFDISHEDLPIESTPLVGGRDGGVRGLQEPPRLQERPYVSRRGGSLLDRLSLDDAAGPSGSMASPSLRERVQIPMKRDLEDMTGGDSLSMDASFDYDDIGGDSASKRGRRRSGKLKRGKKI